MPVWPILYETFLFPLQTMLTAISMSAIATNGVVPGNTWEHVLTFTLHLCFHNVPYFSPVVAYFSLVWSHKEWLRALWILILCKPAFQIISCQSLSSAVCSQKISPITASSTWGQQKPIESNACSQWRCFQSISVSNSLFCLLQLEGRTSWYLAHLVQSLEELWVCVSTWAPPSLLPCTYLVPSKSSWSVC